MHVALIGIIFAMHMHLVLRTYICICLNFVCPVASCRVSTYQSLLTCAELIWFWTILQRLLKIFPFCQLFLGPWYILTIETVQAIDDSLMRGAFAVDLGSNFSRFEKNHNFLINFVFLELKKLLEYWK